MCYVIAIWPVCIGVGACLSVGVACMALLLPVWMGVCSWVHLTVGVCFAGCVVCVCPGDSVARSYAGAGVSDVIAQLAWGCKGLLYGTA